MPHDLNSILPRIERRLEELEISATAASRAAGLGEDAIRNWRRAVRDGRGQTTGMTLRSANALARVLKVTASWLLSGKDGDLPSAIPVIGKVGAGAAGDFDDAFAMGAADDWIEAGGEEDLIGLVVDGDSMVPLAHPGDRVVFGPRYDDPSILTGRRVMARLADGRKLFKVLQPGSRKGLYNLYSLNTAHDPIMDVALEWALPLNRIYVRR